MSQRLGQTLTAEHRTSTTLLGLPSCQYHVTENHVAITGDQQRVTPGGFRRTRPPLPDLKFIRSNFFCVNTARFYRIGKSDTLPDMVIRHKYM